MDVVSKYKYLGVWLTNKLLWDQHIAYLLTEGKRALPSLQRVFSIRKNADCGEAPGLHHEGQTEAKLRVPSVELQL